MKPSLSLRASQHLALTPQLQQSIRLLQLSTLELAQEVEQILDENPFLERQDETAVREEFGLAHENDAPREADRIAEVQAEFDAPDTLAASSTADLPQQTASAGTDTTNAAPTDSAPDGDTQADLQAEPDWSGDGSVESAPDDSEWGGDAPARGSGSADDGEVDAIDLARGHESLFDHLHRQALSLRLGDEDRAALRFLIESLNDDGYLEDSLESLADTLARGDLEAHEELVHRFTVALRLLQSLEPAGVGARSLSECLTLQIRALRQEVAQRPRTDATQRDPALLDLAHALCALPTEQLARRDLKRLAAQVGSDEAQVRAAMALIARLEPKPGRRFADVERHIVVPDVIVSASGRGAALKLRVALNPEVMPRLRVHDVYASALRSHCAEGHQGLQQRLQEARWFIKNIQQRFDTILRVSTAIVERQRNFFVHGELAMRPLVLREIADELGLHESTISRVTTAKYMATPLGTFELKYFFGSGLGTESGSSASSTAVRALIRQFVQAESASKPLSDHKISELLREQGIECARRTVAKYRESMRIAPANLRKAL
ncbi:MAG: RNA polymerase factor sigma-54 [Burkholderiaceae bacterium]